MAFAWLSQTHGHHFNRGGQLTCDEPQPYALCIDVGEHAVSPQPRFALRPISTRHNRVADLSNVFKRLEEVEADRSRGSSNRPIATREVFGRVGRPSLVEI